MGDLVRGWEVGREWDVVEVVELGLIFVLEAPTGDVGFSSNLVPDLTSDTAAGVEGKDVQVSIESDAGVPQADGSEVF